MQTFPSTTRLALLLILPVLACSSAPKSVPSSSTPWKRPVQPDLTEEYATFRGGVVSNTHYDLAFELDGVSSDFSGNETLRFDLSHVPAHLTLDFHGGTLGELTVNGSVIARPETTPYFISLPVDHLKTGTNEVRLRFRHPYSTSGSGLSRFIDPEDQRPYLYTNFEPYRANQMFPCFDQPDLKGVFKLSVKAPADWTVISSTRESSAHGVSSEPGADRQWIFPESKKISTYLFSLHAGPYSSWSSMAGTVPLRLFARRSLARHVIPWEWFATARHGLRFFGSYFDTPYPFGKYDQVIVPELDSAMENVGAVTYSEKYVQRGAATVKDRHRRAEVILHETAHMWFGNLVTLKWWSDLWLNETFATYMAYIALTKTSDFGDAWRSFFSDDKQWAYFEDQLSTTHPVSGHVPDTGQAFAAFDGISYGKGAAVMKQLAFFIGESEFRTGVRKFLKTHAFANASRRNFIEALESVRQNSLAAWSSEWLETAGLNNLSVRHQCIDKKITDFELQQSSSPEHPALRTHRTLVALYYRDSRGRLVKKEEIAQTYAGERTLIPELIGKPCPAFIHLNEGDQDYVRWLMDPASLEVARSALSRFDDPFTRRMIWRHLWDEVRDSRLSLQNYVTLVAKHLPKETDEQAIAPVLQTLETVLDYAPPGSPGELRDSLLQQIERFLWRQFRTARAGSDVQKTYWDSLASIGSLPETLARFAEILEVGSAAPGLKLDPDRRWRLIRQINSSDPPIGEPIRISEMAKDKSNAGSLLAISAEVVQPIYEIKEMWFRQLTHEPLRMRQAEADAAMEHFFKRDQEKFRRHFADKYFQKLLKLANRAELEFLSSYVSMMLPTLCEEGSVKQLHSFLDNNNLPFVASVELKKHKQELERCIRVRSLAVQEAKQAKKN